MQLHYPLNPTTGKEDPTQLPWSDGIPQTSVEGSFPPSAMCVETMMELVNLLGWAGLTGTSSDLNQVTRAIRGGQLDFDATDTGTADAIQVQIGLPHSKVIAGLPFAFIKGPNSNSGVAPLVMTITDPQGNNPVSGQLLKAGGGNLGKGDAAGGQLIVVRADANGNFRLVSLLTISDALALLASLQIPGGRQQTLTGSGTWPVPSGLTVGSIIYVRMIGGGAGGGAAYTGGSYQAAGVGGGAGEYAEGPIVLTASHIANGIAYSVGAGGTGGLGASNPTAGTAGSATSIGGVISAAGGTPGSAGLNGIASGGGTGGTGGTGGLYRRAGGGGGFGQQFGTSGAGGGIGGAAPFGGNSPTISINANGGAGLGPGGGGNGGGANSSSTSGNGNGGSNGGNGAAGELRLFY